METTEKQAAAASGGADGDEAAVPVAASVSECQSLAEGDKAEAGKGKRIVRVSQKYIDIVPREKSTGTGMYRKNRSMEIVENYKGPLDLRSLVAISNGIREKIHADDAAILEQYHRLGYAYTEVDDEEEPSIDKEKVCAPLARSRPQVPPLQLDLLLKKYQSL